MRFIAILRQIRASHKLSLKPLPITRVQINTDRLSIGTAGEQEEKESLCLQSSSSHGSPFLATGQVRQTLAQDFIPDCDVPLSLLCLSSPEALCGNK